MLPARYPPPSSRQDTFPAPERISNPDLDTIPPSRSGTMSPLFGARLPRLDESAGFGLRRNVLLRNAMLSSLEQERLQLIAELAAPASPTDDAPDAMQEAEWFDNLLSELSGQVQGQDTNADTAVAPHGEIVCQDEDDFVRLEHAVSEGNCCGATSDYCMRAVHDSGFAERTSSQASMCSGYPNVCPYPSVLSIEITASEELPALIDDDSDVEDDEDDHEDTGRKLSIVVSPNLSPAMQHRGSMSCPVSPLTNEEEPAILSQFDKSSYSYSVNELFSPEHSRPTSPTSSTSSKGVSDRSSPPLDTKIPSTLPSLASMSLQACTEQTMQDITNRLDLSLLSKHRHEHHQRFEHILGQKRFGESTTYHELRQPTPRMAFAGSHFSASVVDNCGSLMHPGFSTSSIDSPRSLEHASDEDGMRRSSDRNSIVLHWTNRA